VTIFWLRVLPLLYSSQGLKWAFNIVHCEVILILNESTPIMAYHYPLPLDFFIGSLTTQRWFWVHKAHPLKCRITAHAIVIYFFPGLMQRCIKNTLFSVELKPYSPDHDHFHYFVLILIISVKEMYFIHNLPLSHFKILKFFSVSFNKPFQQK
jgi:hypothetical protein